MEELVSHFGVSRVDSQFISGTLNMLKQRNPTYLPQNFGPCCLKHSFFSPHGGNIHMQLLWPFSSGTGQCQVIEETG